MNPTLTGNYVPTGITRTMRMAPPAAISPLTSTAVSSSTTTTTSAVASAITAPASVVASAITAPAAATEPRRMVIIGRDTPLYDPTIVILGNVDGEVASLQRIIDESQRLFDAGQLEAASVNLSRCTKEAQHLPYEQRESMYTKILHIHDQILKLRVSQLEQPPQDDCCCTLM